MSPAAYQAWLPRCIADYAQDKVQALQWPAQSALEKSRQAFEELLVNGLETPHHHLFSILDHDRQAAGMLWVYLAPNSTTAFIYNIEIDEAFRNRGFGSQAIQALEAWLKDRGRDKLQLHVFGHNPQAHRLYERLGFLTTSYNMTKPLA